MYNRNLTRLKKKKKNTTCVVAPNIFFSSPLQGPGPSGKNEEKIQVLTEKIEDLVVQVCNKYGIT